MPVAEYGSEDQSLKVWYDLTDLSDG